MAQGLVIERILRDREGIWRQIAEDRELRPLSGQLLTSAAISLALYGAVLGASNGWLQALASAVKLPILFLVTLAICLPTLYLFNLVFGAKLSVRQALALVSVTITVLSALTLAFAPISLFFLITAPNYSFYKLLNVAIMILTSMVGLKFLIAGMRSMNAAAATTVRAPHASTPPVAAAPVAGPATAEGSDHAGASDVDEPSPVPVTVGAPTGDAAAQPRFAPVAARVAPGPNGGMPHPQPSVHPMQRALPPQPRSASMSLLYVWIVVFGFVGTQLGWTLRPFFGSPGEPFQIFRSIEGNFYVDIVRTLGHLF